MALENDKAPSENDGALYALDEDYFEWSLKGCCRDYGKRGDLFFTKGASSELAAKMLCGVCKVKSNCLEFALKYTQEGIWGGTNDKERNKIRLERSIQPIKLKTMDLSA